MYPRACSLLAEASAMVRDFREAPRETLRVFLQDTLLLGPAAPLLAQLEQHLPQALVRLTASAEDSCLGLVAEHCKAQGDTFSRCGASPV